MNRKEVWDLVRRLRLRLVVDNGRTSDNHKGSVLRKERFIEGLGGKSHGADDILCQLPELIPNNSKNLLVTDKKHKRLAAGALIAKSKGVSDSRDKTPPDMIANAGALKSFGDDEIPNDYQFEIIRLRRRVDELEYLIRDRDRRVVAAITMLEDELAMYRALMHDHIAETHDGIRRRTLRIEATLNTLKEKGSKLYPPLEIPKRWRK